MDFLHRNAPSQPHTRAAAPNTANAHVAAGGGNGGGSTTDKFSHMFNQPKWLRVATVVLLFSITALLVAIVVLLNQGKIEKEANFIDKDRYQAVFLDTDQVYFGRIVDLNNKYVNLADVYYLSAKGGTDKEAASLELVKLGCEVHGPSDQLIINRDQVAFWENVKDESQLAKKIQEYKGQNPDGPTCTTPAANNETDQQSPQQAAGTQENKQQ